ncbi:MAG: glycosyltransferase family 4 protein [Nitrospiraceae bacterium]
MRVIHLSTIHGPLDVRIFYKECRTLAQAGYEVHQVVFNPPASSQDGIAFHSIQRAARIPFIPRILSRLRNTYAVARPLRAHVYHFHDPELVPVGLLLKLQGAKVIYDVHEDSPQEALSINKDRPNRGRMYFVFYVVCDWLAKWLLDGMVAATPALVQRFRAKKTVLVQNFPIQESFQSMISIPYADRRPVAVYVGSIAEIRGINEMVRAMSLIPSHVAATLTLAGRYDPPELEQEVMRLPGWDRIEFRGWLSRDEITQLLGHARLGIVLLHPTPEYLESQPVKLYEYMAAGLPIIASDFPLWRELYEPVGCCMFVNPLDSKAIANAIEWMLDRPQEADLMGRRGIEAVKTRFNWEEEGKKLLQFYEEVVR